MAIPDLSGMRWPIWQPGHAPLDLPVEGMGNLAEALLWPPGRQHSPEVM
jgi:hypothetical protein